jgi:glycosyltransferase involved in cell wall biosynthesis
MALGCPSIVSDTTCLPEICGDAALYASPTKPEAWLEQILRVRSDANLRSDLVARGHERAQLYSWSGSACAYLDAMAGLDHLNPVFSKVS